MLGEVRVSDRRVRLVAGLAVWLGVVAGCGPRRYEVEGRVVYDDGSPFTGGGMVLLEAVVDNKPLMARGILGADGRFTVHGSRPGAGVAVATYRVRLHAAGAVVDIDAGLPPPAPQFAEKFTDFATSGLVCEVPGDGSELVINIGPRPLPTDTLRGPP